MIGNFPALLNFNQLFLKLNWFFPILGQKLRPDFHHNDPLSAPSGILLAGWLLGACKEGHTQP